MWDLVKESRVILWKFLYMLFSDTKDLIITNSDIVISFIIIIGLFMAINWILKRLLEFGGAIEVKPFRFNIKKTIMIMLVLSFIYYFKDDLKLEVTTVGYNTIVPQVIGETFDVRGQILGIQKMLIDTEDYLGEKGALTVAWEEMKEQDILTLILLIIGSTITFHKGIDIIETLWEPINPKPMKILN